MLFKTAKGTSYNLPYLAQYGDYRYSPECTCNCHRGTKDDSIVGFSHDFNGQLIILHHCPVCGDKWWFHVGGVFSGEQEEALTDDYLNLYDFFEQFQLPYEIDDKYKKLR